MPPPNALASSRPTSRTEAPTDALALYKALKLHAATDKPLCTALDVLEQAIRKYGPVNLAVAFNGGKDATVVLHLTRAVVAAYAPSHALHCLYLLNQKEFPSVAAFVREQVALLDLDEVENEADDFKEGIASFTNVREGMCAFVMGTRSTDPHGENMNHFEPSSKGWPLFMRVNPILSWDYHDVWRFLKRFDVPYCQMYDVGYTSIGSIDSTLPNPALRVIGDDGSVSYRPACQLEDAALERAGRVSKNRKKREQVEGIDDSYSSSQCQEGEGVTATRKPDDHSLP